MEIRRNIDELTVEKWSFIFLYGNIFLDSYYLLKKESKKHRRYEILKKYNRIIGRNNTIKEVDIPLPEDVKEEAFNIFTKDIKVMKWTERQ